MSEREFDYFLLDVFTAQRLQGNPLAVFPRAQGLDDREMQRIAGELNLSETVFLLPAAQGAAAVARIFTPRRELNFAGHPTIGSAAIIDMLHAPGESFEIQENVGPVRIRKDVDEAGNRLYWLTTPAITFYETVPPEVCARFLNLPLDDLDAIPPQFVSAGSPLLFIALKSRHAVDRAVLQGDMVGAMLGSVNSVGTFVFARNDGAGGAFDVYSRMFAPQTGIPEDPATGGATGPLAAYMLRNGIVPNGTDIRFTSEQGTKMGRRSIVHVKITRVQDEDPTIEIGGSSVIVARGKFSIDK